MKIFWAIVTFYCSWSICAGWQEFGQESTIISKKVSLEINSDGSYQEHQTISITPISLGSLEESKVILLSFDEVSEDIQLNWVKVCPGDSETCKDINIENIVYEIGEKDASGFSSQKRLKFVVKDFRIKERLIYKYTKKVLVPNLRDNYMSKYYFGYQQKEELSEIEIKSKIPLYFSMNRLNNFKIMNKTPNHLRIVQVKQVYHEFINFSDELIFERDNQYPYVSISSFKDWDSLIIEELKNYKIKKFPSELNKVVNKVRDIKSLEDKLEFLSIWIIENFTYFGDWKRVNGGFRPRNLNNILESKYGDCKDLSQIVVEILKKAGVDASVAFVNRNEDPQTIKFELPSSYYFNHAIVQVHTDGLRYWLDPTNKYFGFNVIPQDIANKMSLVIEGKGKGFTLISERDSLPSHSIKNAHVRKVGKNYNIKLEQKLFGLENDVLASIMKTKSESEIKDLLINILSESNNEEVSDLSLELNRPYIIDEKIFKIVSTKENIFDYKTPQGDIYTFADKFSKTFKLIFENPDLIGKIGKYSIEKNRMVIEDFKLPDMDNFYCEVTSKWFDRIIDVKNVGKAVDISDVTRVKSSSIKLENANDIKAFAMLYEKYKSCFKKSGLLLKRRD